jgi:GT2 family glycosyltransferase
MKGISILLSVAPLVSIIILNWNGELHIHRCIEYVLMQSYTNIEIIIVDNASTDGSLQRIKEKHPNFLYIENHINRGYATGMNQGIKSSKGEFIVPLNQDVCLHKDFITECVCRMEINDKIGVIGGRVYSWINDRLTNIISKGGDGKFCLRKRFQAYSSIKTEKETYVFGAAGSFPFFRWKTLKDIYQNTGDYYDEMYETGWEDLDLFFRMHLRGWKCLFVPGAYGWHVGSGSVGGKDTLLSKPFNYKVRILRNRYFTIIKNLPLRTLIWLFPWLALTEICMIPYFLFYSPSTLLALVKAYYLTILKLSAVIQKRIRIMKNIKVDQDYLKQFFIKF